MELSIMDRVLLVSSLHQQKGNIIYLKVKRDLEGKLSLNSEEIKKFQVVMKPNGNITWRLDVKPQETEIELNDIEKNLIKEFLIKMDKEQSLSNDHISLYEKFVENKQ